jgi:hypothetical protein
MFLVQQRQNEAQQQMRVKVGSGRQKQKQKQKQSGRQVMERKGLALETSMPCIMHAPSLAGEIIMRPSISNVAALVVLGCRRRCSIVMHRHAAGS